MTPPAGVQGEPKTLRVSGIDSDQDSAVSVKRHSSVISSSTSSNSSLSQSTIQNVALRSSAAAHLHTNNTASSTERRLPRRVTTRRGKLSRKSTRRLRIPEINISEFDDDNDADVGEGGEELEFSETDSDTNENEPGSGSCDDSDLEFETELARQMNVSQVHSICLFIYATSAFSALTLLVGRQEEHPACNKN